MSFWINTSAFGQTISGAVFDNNNGEPLAGVNISLLNSKYGCSADSVGRFAFNIDRLNLSEGEHQLQFSYIGYHDLLVSFRVPYLNTKPIEVLLKPSLLQLDQIVVTGTRTERFLKDTPVSTRVLGAQQLKASGGGDIGQALSELTGIVINENQFSAGVNAVEIQGFSSEHIQILLNGMKMIGRVNGQLDISQIPLSQVERVEIVKGAASTLYGSEAMGGVVNIITKKSKDKWNLGLDMKGGSYGRLDGAVFANASLGNWRPELSLSYRRYNGYDLDDNTKAEDGTAFQKYHGRFSLNGKLNESAELNIESLMFQENHEIILNNDFMEKIGNIHRAVRIETKLKNIYSEANIKAGAEYSLYNHTYDEVVRKSGYLRKGSLTKERLAKADILFDFDIDAHQLNGGYALESEWIESDRVSGRTRETKLHNLFLQDEWPISNLLTLLSGIRLDVHSAYGNQLSPKIAAMLSPSNRSRLRLSYAGGFRAPSFKELYLDYINTGVNYHVIGNPHLKPEISKALQIDYELWNDNNYHLRLHFFYNQIQNLINYDYSENLGGYGTYRAANLQGAQTWGADWDMEYFPYHWLNIKIGYSYLDSYNESRKEPLAFRSKDKVQAAVIYKLESGSNLSMRGQYFGKKFDWNSEDENPNNETKKWINGYALFHFNFNFPVWKGIKGDAGVRNITDYVNKTHGPMPGREWYLGLGYQLNEN
jgi:outer membrane receptor for ferrienterochelin and colicins